MVLKQQLPPDVEPLSLDECIAHLRVTDDAEDELISLYMVSARRWVEDYTRRALIKQSWRMYMPNFPSGRGEILLPKGKASAVTGFNWYVPNSETLGLLIGPTSPSPSDGYQENIASDEGPILSPPLNGSWPANVDLNRRPGPVWVDWDAGYGTKGSDVPEGLRTAILYRLTDLYEFRGEVDGNGTAGARIEAGNYRIDLW